MDVNSVVLLFMKAPIKGRVKSRLASVIGPDHALNLYKNFVLDVLEIVHRTGYPVKICFYPRHAENDVREWLGSAHQYLSQNGNDLGERMAQAFKHVFSEGFARAVLIGSDIPDLKEAVIQQAFSSLETDDVVLGPARDGGYYLIGFNKSSFLSQPFRGIVWSSPSVFQDTLGILQSASRKVRILSEWQDVDTMADLKSFFNRSTHSECCRSRTAEYLHQNARDIFD